MIETIKKYYPHLFFCSSFDIIFDHKVRNYCAENKCNKYNKSWCCPPAIKEIDLYLDKTREFKKAIIFSETFSYNEKDPDDAYRKMKIFQDKSIKLKEELISQKKVFLIYGAGTCMICPQCSYPDYPCLHEGKPVISMEAIGIDVFKTLKNNKIEYPNIPNTITFYGCIFYEK